MTNLRRIVSTAIVGIAVAISAFGTSTAADAAPLANTNSNGTSVIEIAHAVNAFTAKARSAVAGDYTDRVQSPHNKAGVIFHPYGDKFEIFNNHPDGKHPAHVIYREDDWSHWKSIDQYDHHNTWSVPGGHELKEYPHQVAFLIWSYYSRDVNGGWSRQVRYRTWGH